MCLYEQGVAQGMIWMMVPAGGKEGLNENAREISVFYSTTFDHFRFR